MKDIIRLNYDCNNTHLKIKESNDRMQKKHSKVKNSLAREGHD